ncbi:MAG: type I methionyl aminopeptidase [Proteobacteria bacterium]|nr:type I methionyl aminopeptidase [Pseudomonadota bacterium]
MTDAHNIICHDASAFDKLRAAGRLAASTLDFITPFVKADTHTLALNDLCHSYITQHGATPAPLGYKGYPKATCISVNHVVCHGIPSEQKRLADGDIVNIDVTVILDGWYGDTSRMFWVGVPPIKAKRLTEITYEAMMLGITAAKPNATLGDIGAAIQAHAEAARFSVVRDFTGHGIGREFHTNPTVLHYGTAGEGVVLKPGMVFTIEPMINAGGRAVKILDDGWTAVTRDRCLSAQFEHTIGVTETGAEIFTLSPKGFTMPPYMTSAPDTASTAKLAQ